MDTVLAIIVRRVVGALKAQQASIMLFDPDDEMLVTRAYYGLEGEFALNGRAGWARASPAGSRRTRRRCCWTTRASPDMTAFQSSPKHHFRALRSPADRRPVVGVLNVNRIYHPEPFTDRQKDVLRMFAEHVGTVIQRAES